MVELRERTAALLSKHGLRAEAARLRGCGHRNGEYAPTRTLCGSTNWCPFDISFKAQRQRKWMYQVISKSPGTWVHVTAPAKSCLPTDLREHTLAAITGTKRLVRHAPLQIIASLSAMEYTPYDDNSKLTNAHVHSLVLVRRQPGVPLVPFNEWYPLWEELCPGELARSIDVDPVTNGPNGTRNVAEYLTKDALYVDNRPGKQGFLERWSDRLDDPKRFITEVQQTTRLWRFFGNLKRPKGYRDRQEWIAPWLKKASS